MKVNNFEQLSLKTDHCRFKFHIIGFNIHKAMQYN